MLISAISHDDSEKIIGEHKQLLITHDKTVYYDYMFAFADGRWGIVRRQ